MQPAPLPPKPTGVISAGEMLFFFVLFLFLVIVCVWPILTWRIHHFSTWAPDAVHSYPVRDHSGGTVYLHPAFGKFYVSLPWLWGALLAGTVLTGLLGTRQPGGKK
jgi:fatty acid desaturase